MVHRADVAEGPAADGRLDEIGDERIPRGAADALAEPIRHADEDRSPRRGHQARRPTKSEIDPAGSRTSAATALAMPSIRPISTLEPPRLFTKPGKSG
jgi:hypothetical protein